VQLQLEKFFCFFLGGPARAPHNCFFWVGPPGLPMKCARASKLSSNLFLFLSCIWDIIGYIYPWSTSDRKCPMQNASTL